MHPRSVHGSTLLLATACFATACSPKETREATVAEPVASKPAEQAVAQPVAQPAVAGPAKTSTSNGVSYELPSGWVALPAAQFREVNFRVAGADNAECYMTTLGGGGGGIDANVNRWRGQIGHAPLTSAQIAALPTTTWFGASASIIDLEGDWGGMSGKASMKNWRLVGLIQVAGDKVRTLKMTGPRELIAAELENFQRLVASFRAAE